MSNHSGQATPYDEKDKGDLSHVDRSEPPTLADVGRQGSYLDDTHVDLTWRTWMTVFWCCFAIMAQVFVVVAAGSVIAFIIPSFPTEAGLVGWIIQAPLLMQAVLSPSVGRLSDVLDRKMMASLPPLVAFGGAVMSAKASNMTMLIVGGILIGTTLSTIAIVQSIPSEILPLKYRALANGFSFLGGAVGGLVGVLGAGGVTNANPAGWRNIYWIQAAFHLATCAGLLVFYNPKRRSDYPKMSIGELIWAIDPIGSLLIIVSATLLLLGLDWAAGTYEWSDAHVVAPLCVGGAFLIAFCLYEWKGRSDGIVAHVFFKGNNNFALSVFAFAVEGWIFYSAVNSVVPQIVLRLGFESNAWRISVRQLSYNVVTLVASIPIMWYATRYKDLKTPLLATFALFLVVCICYATITPSMNKAQIGYNVIAGIGQSGPLTLIVALIQFCAPHSHLSTATGLGFSARAIGGAFGSAVLDAIINSRLSKRLAPGIAAAAIGAGLPESQVEGVVTAALTGTLATVEGVSPQVVSAITVASQNAYASAFRLAYASIIPFVVVAMAAIAALKGVKELMTEHVEATVEKVAEDTPANRA